MSHRESSHTVVVTGSDQVTARDPNARCDTCGVQGTIALFEHDKPPRQVERYCDNCWPARRDALEAAGIYGGWEVLSWRFVEEFVEIVEEGIADNRARGKNTPEQEAALPAQLHQMATEILQGATEYDGPMPSRVAHFIERHRSATA